MSLIYKNNTSLCLAHKSEAWKNILSESQDNILVSEVDSLKIVWKKSSTWECVWAKVPGEA